MQSIMRKPERRAKGIGRSLRKLRSLRRGRRSSDQRLSRSRSLEDESLIIKEEGYESSTTVDEDESSISSDMFETESLVSTASFSTRETMQNPLQIWLHDAAALAQSSEMRSFASSTCDLALVATGTAVRVAFFPITMPVRVVTGTTSLVVRKCVNVTGAVAHQVFPPSVGEDTASARPWDELIRNATKIVPFVFHTAGKIRDEIGATVIHMISPPVAQESEQRSKQCDSPKRYTSKAGESSAESDFLERLRLDYNDTVEGKEFKEDIVGKKEVFVKSEFLLRVADLGVSAPGKDSTKAVQVYYIDLSKEHADTNLTKKALDAFATNGLALASNFDNRFFKPIEAGPVRWKPEGQTERLLKLKTKVTPEQWTSRLEREVLIWSGKFKDEEQYGKKFPLFLARTFVRMSPRAVLQMMWDNKRTGEYNKWNLGRTDMLVLEDGNVLNDGDVAITKGTKVVGSETKVPFTNLSVTLSTLMHVRPLPDNKGYVVISRTLNSGKAGYHVHSNAYVDPCGKNEILWGVNLLQNVEGDPNLTDFTSLSHVASNMVPGFLSKKIGIMGVEDFFNAVRALDKK